MKDTITFDPGNPVPLTELAHSLYLTRQFTACEQAYKRLIDFTPDHPILKVLKAYYIDFMKTGDDTEFRSALAALPASMAEGRDVFTWRLISALNNRDWKQATELIENMKHDEDDGGFAYAAVPVPVGCYLILIARLRGKRPDAQRSFAAIRETLKQKIEMSPDNIALASKLAVVDALLGRKQEAIALANMPSRCYQ